MLSSAAFVPDVSDSAGTTVLTGTLQADPDSTYLIQFFANPTADPSGYGQGQVLIGSFDVATDASGSADFAATFTTADLTGQVVTATATDPNGNTSEFAQDVNVASGSGTSLTVPIGDDSTSTQTELESVVSELQNVPAGTTPPTVALQPATADQLDSVVSAIDALAPPEGQSGPTITITVDLGGESYQTDTTMDPPSGVNVVIQNGTLEGDSPALTVDSGSVTLIGVTALNNTSAPTILVDGGSLIVRNSAIDGSTVPGEAAISITGGTVDLGTSASPGGNAISINSGGEFVHNTTTGSVPTVGDTFTVNGTTQSATELSFTSLSSSLMPSVFGQKVTFAVTITPDNSGDPNPTGTVTFVDETSGTTLATVNLTKGTAHFATPSLGAGTDDVVASYSGDNRYLLSLDQLPQTVNQDGTTTKLSSSANPSVYGRQVTFSATVKAAAPGSGTPAGSVTFADGSTPLGSGTLNASGVATYTTTAFQLGAGGGQSVTAVYGGDGNFTSSTSNAVTQTVNQDSTTTSVASAVNPSVYGQPVTFTATVSANSPGSGTPTGSVTFYHGSTSLGTVTLTGNTASFISVSPLPVGSDSIRASYSGDPNLKSSTGTLSQTVNQDSTTIVVASAADPSAFGQSVSFTAIVSASAPGSGTPTGSVTFTNGTTTLGTVALSGGIASYSTAKIATGLDTITATYNGSSSFVASSGNLTQTVNHDATTTSVASSLNPSTYGQPVTFSATVSANSPGSGTPTGTVTFYDGTTSIGTGTLSGGKATIKMSTLPAGSDSITVVYDGDMNFVTSTSAALIQTVNFKTSTTNLTQTMNNAGTAIALDSATATVDQVLGALENESAADLVINELAIEQQ